MGCVFFFSLFFFSFFLHSAVPITVDGAGNVVGAGTMSRGDDVVDDPIDADRRRPPTGDMITGAGHRSSGVSESVEVFLEWEADGGGLV